MKRDKCERITKVFSRLKKEKKITKNLSKFLKMKKGFMKTHMSGGEGRINNSSHEKIKVVTGSSTLNGNTRFSYFLI